jgi:CubicO group peptidase (beta-lactamase class C family)
MKYVIKRFIGLLLLFAIAVPQPAKDFELTNPEKVGLSSERLAKIRPVMQKYIDDSKLSALMTLVSRHGKLVHFETCGMADIEAEKPLSENSIFRIYSMTKPITSTAIMMLYEEGHFQLWDPVSKYIPEFKNMKVFAGGTIDSLILEKPTREMTILDLLRHTAGLTYTWDSTPVDELYRRKKIFNPQDNLHDMMVKLGEIPLLYQPGTKYHYSVAMDVLGYLVEVISGMSFDRFLKERIFDPLEMEDTAFYVPESKLDRFIALYNKTDDNKIRPGDHPNTSKYRNQPTAPSGGGGLVSTPLDYLKFAQMILNKGELNGRRLLGRQTVEYMLQNHLPEGTQVWQGLGYGLGFGIVTDPAKNRILCSNGESSWSGMANTFFWIDLEEDLIYMVWTQLFPWGVYDYRHQFRVMVHSAIIE